MFFRTRKKDDDITSPSGLGAICHKVVMFITYPFRKPLYLLGFVFLFIGALYGVPMYKGVKITEVHLWYLNKIERIKGADLSRVSGEITNIINKLPIKSSDHRQGIDKLVDVKPDYREIRRQMFSAASSSEPQKVDILAKESDNIVTLPSPLAYIEEETKPLEDKSADIVNETVQHLTTNETAIIKETEDNVLRYLDEPEEISGTVKVYNANELEVGGIYLFLYGIYSNPDTVRGAKATSFLQDSLSGLEILCKIIAYTADNIATAECYVDDISINQVLVDRGFSDKVVLQ